jgi:DNA-directed RNA polymerase specialized sigma24 family protein
MEFGAAPGPAEALRGLAEGPDSVAWSYLAREYGRAITVMAERMLRDRALAEDACQETLLQVRTHAGRFRAPKGDADAGARSWLFHVAYNVARKIARSRDRALRPRQGVAVAGRGGPGREALMEAVREEVLQLPESYVFNGRQVSREEYERRTEDARRQFEAMCDRINREGNGSSASSSSASSSVSEGPAGRSEEYLVNGREVTREEFERHVRDNARLLPALGFGLHGK